ncbi:EamA family transporter [Novosphingobium sp. BL-8H]|uniref:EamA family transporter n=1 Tax=Novosphingobium sp. BL-8H TaxID=3127640 RepID=UPI003756D461
MTTILVTGSAAAIAMMALPFLPAPAAASWPFIAASAVLQVIYYSLVARTYALADMSATYPLMRGTAPLLVALATASFLAEPLAPMAWLGVAAICTGILSTAIREHSGHGKGVALALLNALVIASYTLVDGFGVRRSGAPAAYTLWIFLLTGIPLVGWALWRRRKAFLRRIADGWLPGLGGGLATVASYGLALWAMTLAPVAVIAALRETSILFATAIAGFVLKERVGRARVVGAVMIALGAALLRLA